MNKNAQVTIGGLVILAIAIIVGAIILQASAQNIGGSTNTISTINRSFTSVANGSYITLDGVEVVGTPTVYNGTLANGTIIAAGNYSITNREVVNGVLVSRLQILNPQFAGANATTWNMSYTYEPSTYIDDSGGRSMASLVIIMMAVALIAIVVVYVIQNYKAD